MGSFIGHLLPGLYFFMLGSWGFSNEAWALARTYSRYIVFIMTPQGRGRYDPPYIEIHEVAPLVPNYSKANYTLCQPNNLYCLTISIFKTLYLIQHVYSYELPFFYEFFCFYISFWAYFIALSLSRCRGPGGYKRCGGYRSRATHQGGRKWPLESGIKLAAFSIQVGGRYPVVEWMSAAASAFKGFSFLFNCYLLKKGFFWSIFIFLDKKKNEL